MNIHLGAMSDAVRSVHVKMRYPGYRGPSAEQSFELTKEKPTAGFFTYTGQSGDPGSYRYQITYMLADGQRMDVAEQAGQSETLTIPDPFEQRVTTRFLAQGDFTVVQKIIVDARYRDAANDFAADHHAELASNGESSAWTFGLRDPNRRDIEYDVKIINKDGSSVEQRGLRRRLGETIPVGVGAVDALEVTVVPAVDWNKYKLVLVYLEYADPANNIREEANFILRKETSADQRWKVLLRDGQRRSFRHRVRYVGVNSADNKETTWTETTDPILVVE
ncbi:MAG: hypothetical protein HY660_15030 [Armatimonadetes bacterium]|nr:hypothetical protein [Armatimonadota bacterium]